MSAIHPDEATLLRSVLGELTERRQAGLKRHVARCRPCRKERERTTRLHERLSETGDSLAFAAGDPFESRPIPRETGAAARPTVETLGDALGRLEKEKATLKPTIKEDPLKAAQGVHLDNAAVRLAVAHLLEERIAGDPSKEFSVFGEAVATRLAEEPPKTEGDVDAVVPRAQLVALASLASGSWRLFCGRPGDAGFAFRAAWAALGDFDAPEHLVAWAEAGESLRRSYDGHATEGRLLAERALATFERYGLERGALRARHARAVALYTAGEFREAHREFRSVIASRDATRLDRARAVNGAAFCLAARGRFHNAAKEYSRVRRKLGGEGAQVEQYLLQGEMKVALGTAGRWHQRPDGLAAFALPEAGGAFHARDIAAEIVALAGGQGIEAAQTRLAAIEGDPARGYALLYAAQLAARVASSDPLLHVDFARELMIAARSLPFLKDKGPAQPVCREQVIGEASVLESSALNFLGRAAEARRSARNARLAFVEAGEDSFAIAIADFVEGSAASFEGDFRSAWTLLRDARAEFQLYGQEHWVGRADAALGTMLLNRNRNASALVFFDSAVRNLHPDQDGIPYTFILANRAGSLLLLGRLDAAKATYAKALAFARKFDIRVAVFGVRYGLASIELKKGELFRALHSFRKIAVDARTEGFEQRVLSAELRAAECLGRLGQHEEMLIRVRALRREITGVSVDFDPPLRDLFAQADEADVSSELVAYVVEYLEARDRGVQKGYRPFKLVANGK